jgi:hypothetical protein
MSEAEEGDENDDEKDEEEELGHQKPQREKASGPEPIP